MAYRAGRRFTQSFVAAPAGTGPVLVRDGGVYLITGGLGGVGLQLAEHLARRSRNPRLVLTGRQGLPPRETWPNVVETDPGSRDARRIKRILRLEELGASVQIHATDVDDPMAMNRLVQDVRRSLGGITGVVHAIGLTAPEMFQPIQTMMPTVARAHFAAKVDTLVALDAALDREETDFRVLMSSISTVLGGLGFAAYAGANAVLDAYAERAARVGSAWTSIDWDTWASSDAPTISGGLGAAMVEFSMTADDALAAFDRALTVPRPRVVVSTGDLEARLQQWVKSQDAQDMSTGGQFPRPELAQPYEPPGAGDQRRLAEIWQQALGIDRVGIDDNFFDLGGNSLIGLQLVRRVGEEFAPQRSRGRAVRSAHRRSRCRADRYLSSPDDEPESATHRSSRELNDTPGARARARAGPADIAIIGMAGRFPGAARRRRVLAQPARRRRVDPRSSPTRSCSPAGVDAGRSRRPELRQGRGRCSTASSMFDAGFFGYHARARPS